ncbi:MAG: endolytic transglycosylase MltG [Candidatus Kerfeldbacteria bacterium]|nr:endolytic transglycosylase MltG [Candidatus Kerfeldbacteria bacterium]
MSRRLAALRATLSFVVPVVIVGAAAAWFFVQLQPVDRTRTETVTLTVEAGAGLQAIAKQLKQAGLIRNPLAFQIAVGLAGLSKDLQAGMFEVSPASSATAIARQLAGATGPREVTVTMIEGWTSRQIAELLQAKAIGSAEAFVAAAQTTDSRTILPDDRFDFLAGRPATASLEGYLFPDTYRFFPDATPAEVVKKMLTNFEAKVVVGLGDDLAASNRTLFDVIRLASIVEREVRTDRDRRLAADIFWRRLAAGIALQSDATVNYVTGKSALQPTIADTEVDSPYNTYRNRGLPPGPIGNPGLSSIQAVLRPEANGNFYFLTDASGTVYYAKTFEEHVANKQRYLQ